MPYTYPYPRPALTADAVVFTIRGQRLQVLLVHRGGEPFAGSWALPGGFVEEGECASDAVKRELTEEAGVRDVWFEQLKTFDAPGRDPRGWVVSVAHVALIDSERVRLAGADDAVDARWWPMNALPPLAFDHQAIVQYALERLRSKLRWSNIGLQLLPLVFTMDALRRVHEAVLDDAIDKRNFHKRMVESGAIRDTGARLANGKRGPQPRLYAFVPRTCE
ncbi:MAG TPA: NUDIX domain-containing protein [Chloroflexota bacterium]|nr:NUDIX domain-containing protein [Chloroflexota bacterium]